MRNLFVKGFMAAAAVAALASCSNDEGANVPAQPAEMQEVQLGVSVAVPGSKAATSAGDVNQVNDGTFADITDIYVIPTVGGAFQGAISLGTLTDEASVKYTYKTEEVAANVDGFRVYANVPKATIEGIANSSFTYTAPASTDFKDSNSDYYASGEGVKATYPLFYYANTADNGGFSTATGSDWTAAAWSDNQTSIGANNLIKIGGVSYAVGVLAAGVLESATADDETVGDASTNIGDNMELVGVVVQGQPAAVNQDMEAANASEVMVFAAATNKTLQGSALDWDATNDKVVTGANIYGVMMPEDAQQIMLSFQFQNNTGETLEMTNGETVANGAYAYYTATVSPKNSLKIFDAGYTTLLNGTIKSWFSGTSDIPTPKDLTVGVDFDVDWKQGIKYDVDLQ